jgi:phenylpropionate dioxygenase-like ring-hydroxylating dioxygenase large terminal subunit
VDEAAAPLREPWYYATPGRRLKRGGVLAKTMLAEPLLLGRDKDGRVFALRDICPHRAIPLSEGRFDGGDIECCYHGWRLATDGRCTAIPSLAAGSSFDPARVRVRPYPVREVEANIWVFFGDDPAAAPGIPLVAESPDQPVAAEPRLVESVRFAAAIDHAVVGLMDPAHGPFVHRAWWWRSRASIHEKEKAFAPSSFGFTMSRHAPSTNSRAYQPLGGGVETEIVFRLPSVRIERVRAGRNSVVSLTAITAIDDGLTEIHHCIYWRSGWLDLLKPLLRPYVRGFLRQDRDIMARQQKGLAFEPPLADRRRRHAGQMVLPAEARIPARPRGRPPVRQPSRPAYPQMAQLTSWEAKA